MVMLFYVTIDYRCVVALSAMAVCFFWMSGHQPSSSDLNLTFYHLFMNQK